MILVTGANGVVGAPLVAELQNLAQTYLSVSRSPKLNAIHWDLREQPSQEAIAKLDQCSELIHCAPIWLLTPHLATLIRAGIKRLVVFSSTSIISKKASSNPQERELVRQLEEAEQGLQSICAQHGVVYTILRPSLIYGYGRDQNVSHIAGFIKKWRFCVLVGDAAGLRQPVHADDLVDAAITCLKLDEAANKVFNLAGAQTLSYRAMVIAIANGLNIKPRILTVPLSVMRMALKISRLLGKFNYTPEMADRMSQDLVYSNEAARQAIAYQPQSFLSNPERDLP